MHCEMDNFGGRSNGKVFKCAPNIVFRGGLLESDWTLGCHTHQWVVILIEQFIADCAVWK